MVQRPESIAQSPAFKMTPHAGTCTRSESNNLSCDVHVTCTNLEDIKMLSPVLTPDHKPTAVYFPPFLPFNAFLSLCGRNTSTFLMTDEMTNSRLGHCLTELLHHTLKGLHPCLHPMPVKEGRGVQTPYSLDFI